MRIEDMFNSLFVVDIFCTFEHIIGNFEDGTKKYYRLSRFNKEINKVRISFRWFVSYFTLHYMETLRLS